jgi:hypothetical protein
MEKGNETMMTNRIFEPSDNKVNDQATGSSNMIK